MIFNLAYFYLIAKATELAKFIPHLNNRRQNYIAFQSKIQFTGAYCVNLVMFFFFLLPPGKSYGRYIKKFSFPQYETHIAALRDAFVVPNL
jgi:hypothetical protein